MEVTIIDDKYEMLNALFDFTKGVGDDKIITMKTQSFMVWNSRRAEHEHVFKSDSEIIVKSDRMIILQEHTCSVIDLRNEMPYEVTVKHA